MRPIGRVLSSCIRQRPCQWPRRSTQEGDAPFFMLNEEAVSGDPYAMCVLGLRLPEKAKTKCEGVGEYGCAAGLYATSPDVIDYEAFNKAGQFILLSSESAKTGGIRKLLRVASRALRTVAGGCPFFQCSCSGRSGVYATYRPCFTRWKTIEQGSPRMASGTLP